MILHKITILHRYVTEDGIDIVKNLRLRLSNPLELNDPFECLVALPDKGELITDYKKKLENKEHIDFLYERNKREGENRGVFGQWIRDFRKNDEKLDKQLGLAYGDLPETFLEHKEQICKEMHILCFVDSEKTNHSEEILMWFHYTDSHKGLRFHFECDEFYCKSNSLYKIIYADTRCLLNPLKEDTWMDILGESLKTKSKAWSYENEYRYFIDLAECQQESGHYYVDIPASSIKRIDIGLNCSEETKNEIIELVNTKAELRHIDVYQAEIHKNKYELIYNRLQ